MVFSFGAGKIAWCWKNQHAITIWNFFFFETFGECIAITDCDRTKIIAKIALKDKDGGTQLIWGTWTLHSNLRGSQLNQSIPLPFPTDSSYNKSQLLYNTYISFILSFGFQFQRSCVTYKQALFYLVEAPSGSWLPFFVSLIFLKAL